MALLLLRTDSVLNATARRVSVAPDGRVPHLPLPTSMLAGRLYH